MMIFLTVGEKLRRLRHQLNIEQDVLTQIGVSRNFISMIETNKRDLTETRAIQLTELLRSIAKDKNIDLDISDDYLLLEPSKEAEKYCCSALENLKTLSEANDIYEIIKAYSLELVKPKYFLAIADMLFEEKNYASAFVHYLDSLDYYRRINNHEKTPYIYNRLGRCRSLKLDYSEALFYFAKSYESALLYKDDKMLKIVLYNVAWCNINLKETENALHFINRYLELCNTKDTFEDYIRGTILKADCYAKKQDFELAITIYTDSIKLFEDAYNPLLGYIYNNLGEISMKINSFTQALQYFDKAQLVIEKSAMERISHTLIHKAELYLQNNDYDEALLQTVQAIAYAKSFKDNEYLYKGYKLLETIYSHTNNTEKLKQVYTDMLTLLKGTSNLDSIMKIHAKLSIINMNDNKALSLQHLQNIVDM